MRPPSLAPAPRALALAALAAAAASCGERAAPGERPTVLVSVAPQAFFVERLAGDEVRVVVLIPPGASPHAFEPTVAQVQAFERASLHFAVGHPGFGFEAAWVERLLDEHPDIRRASAAAGAELLPDDPHLWLSPRVARSMAAELEPALAAVLPRSAERIAERRRALESEIDALDAEIGAELAPWRGRAFLVLHPAWAYFARDYGLEQLAIEPEGKEPSARALAQLIERAREARIRTVFVDPQSSRREAEVVAGELGARVEVLDPLARDWPANLRATARALSRSFAE
jgi:zinc transport system substrate-binding protein